MKTRFNTIWKAALALLVLAAGMVTEVSAQSGKIYGVVRERNGEVAPGAKVSLKKDEMPVLGKGAYSDENGKYEISNLEPGTYTLVISYLGGENEHGESVVVSDNYVPTDLVAGEIIIEGGGPIMDRRVFDVDPIDKIGMTRDEMVQSGIRDYKTVISIQPGVSQKDVGDPLNIGGQRSSGTVTVIDGNRMLGTASIPQAAVEQVMLLSGGVPSEYGDVNGGVITITTRNPGMKGYYGPARSLVNIKEKKAKSQEKGQPESSLDQDFHIDSYAFDN